MPLKATLKTGMPEQAAATRAHNFIEVNEGYTDARGI